MGVTFSLLRLIAWRRLKKEPFRLLLTLVGVALGVAVFIAVKMANETSTRAFENSLAAISGKTQLEVSGGGLGVDEDLILRLRAMREVKRAAPVIQQHVWIKKAGGAGARWRRGAPSQGSAVLVLGLDLLGDNDFRGYEFENKYAREEILSRIADPEGLFVARGVADALGLGVGDFVEVEAARRMRFRVRGVLKPEGMAKSMDGRLIILDIGVAQEVFERYGRLDRIDLILEDGIEIESIRENIRSILPPGAIVERPARRGRDVEKMLASFQLNLTVLSVISLLVGCFLIYNTMSASVLAAQGRNRHPALAGRNVEGNRLPLRGGGALHRPGGFVPGRCDGRVHGPGRAFVHLPDDPQPLRVSGGAARSLWNTRASLGIRRGPGRFAGFGDFPGDHRLAPESAPGHRGEAGKGGGAAQSHRRFHRKRLLIAALIAYWLNFQAWRKVPPGPAISRRRRSSWPPRFSACRSFCWARSSSGGFWEAP